MFKETIKQIKTALILLMVLTVLTGVLYPLAVTALAQLFFPAAANGSLIKHKGQTIGSRFIGQSFTAATYFWGRPSATMPYPYKGNASSGSNLGPSNPDLLNAVKERIAQLQHIDPQNKQALPVDLVTASGSGLDPEISPFAAQYQVPRIAKARQISEAEVSALINQYRKNRTWSLLGEPRVNVLELNIALDHLRMNHDANTPQS